VLRKAAEAARAKISAVLPQETQATTIAPLSAPGPHDGSFPKDAVSLDLLRTAIRDQKKLAIEYADEKQQFTERVIWPIQLGFMDAVRIVTGWCELRQDFRFFRTDRMISANIGDIYPKRRAVLLREFQVRFGVRL
jgi:predicted DNA-binding transcriptional regulator YafY